MQEKDCQKLIVRLQTASVGSPDTDCTRQCYRFVVDTELRVSTWQGEKACWIGNRTATNAMPASVLHRLLF